MNSLGWHVMLRLEDDRVLAPSVAARRAVARAVLRVGGSHRMFVFNAADTHLHVGLLSDRGSAGRFSQSVKLALASALELPVPFELPRMVPIRDRRHLENLLHYVSRNHDHHGVQHDPLRDASNLPDLLGLRVIGASTAHLVSEVLPSVRAAHLERHLPVGRLGVPTTWDPLLDAAAASVGRAELRSNEPEVRDARGAAVRVALRLGASRKEVGEILGVSARSVRRYARADGRPDLERAIQGQLALREQLAALEEARPELAAGAARSGGVRRQPSTPVRFRDGIEGGWGISPPVWR